MPAVDQTEPDIDRPNAVFVLESDGVEHARGEFRFNVIDVNEADDGACIASVAITLDGMSAPTSQTIMYFPAAAPGEVMIGEISSRQTRVFAGDGQVSVSAATVELVEISEQSVQLRWASADVCTMTDGEAAEDCEVERDALLMITPTLPGILPVVGSTCRVGTSSLATEQCVIRAPFEDC
jgi:hypothetical protein